MYQQENIQELQDKIDKLTPKPVALTNVSVGDLVMIQHYDTISLHYITFVGVDEVWKERGGFDKTVIKLDGNFLYLQEDGTPVSCTEPRIFAIHVFHKYDIRFKCISDR